MKFREAVLKAQEALAAAGIADAATDSWYLLQYVMKEKEEKEVDRTWFLMNREDEMPQELLAAYQELAEKRRSHIPLQHLTHEQEFMGYSFYVNEDVLVPRQDTEVLVEEAMRVTEQGMIVLDMCTGSGCILLSLMKEQPGLTGIGADLSEKALQVAGLNNHRLKASATFLKSDLFESIEGSFDLIVSNPPYIASAEIETLSEEVRVHEPRMALDGSADGLYYYRRITEESPRFLKAGGFLMFEIGYDQGEAVTKLMKENGFHQIEVVKDLAGLDRVIKGKK